MAEVFDDDQSRRIIDNQPYDESLEVPDAEDIASIHSTTLRFQYPRNNYHLSVHSPNKPSNTPPLTGSSLSSGSANDHFLNQEHTNSKLVKMNDSPREPSPKFKTRTLEESIDEFYRYNEINNNEFDSGSNYTLNGSNNLSQNQHFMKEYQYLKNRSKIANPSLQSIVYKGALSTLSDKITSVKNSTNQDISTFQFNKNKPDEHQDMNLNKNNMKNDMEDSASDGNDSVNDSQDNYDDLPGAYDPAAFRDLPVSSEIKEIFNLIERFKPQNIELEFKLEPFIPDYIPCIGDIDAFIKVPRPDGKEDNLGLTFIDEPSSNQSDPHVIDLFFRTLSKQTVEVAQPTSVKSIEGSNTKAIDSWIRNISALQKNKPIQTVNYQRAMPSIDKLMEVWTPEFEELLKEVGSRAISLPSPELNVDLNTYVDILCALLDIPVYKSKVQSIHVLFTLFSEFKNSEHFKNPAQTFTASSAIKQNDNKRTGKGVSDQLVID